MKKTKLWLGVLANATVLLTSGLGAAPLRDDGMVRRALQAELDRTMQRLVLPGEAKPHFAQYTVLDADGFFASASYGALTVASGAPSRAINVSLRVGTPELDSSNAGYTGGATEGFEGSPIEDDEAALRRELWLASDAEYKAAVESLSSKKAALSARVNERGETYPDFAAEPRHETVVAAPRLDAAGTDRALTTAVEKLSALAGAVPNVLASNASAERSTFRRRLLSSEQT